MLTCCPSSTVALARPCLVTAKQGRESEAVGGSWYADWVCTMSPVGLIKLSGSTAGQMVGLSALDLACRPYNG